MKQLVLYPDRNFAHWWTTRDDQIYICADQLPWEVPEHARKIWLVPVVNPTESSVRISEYRTKKGWTSYVITIDGEGPVVVCEALGMLLRDRMPLQVECWYG